VLADEDWTARFEANLAADRADQAMRDFMSDVGGYSEEEIDAMQGTPAWSARIAAAPTVPRELHAEHGFAIDDLRLSESTVPTLLLVGSDSPSWAKRSVDTFAAAIPQSELHVLHGHGHGAATSAPELLASELRGFYR
jgi:pimeloyl-ACP methyl ester carboxylesterase